MHAAMPQAGLMDDLPKLLPNNLVVLINNVEVFFFHCSRSARPALLQSNFWQRLDRLFINIQMDDFLFDTLDLCNGYTDDFIPQAFPSLKTK